MLTQLQFSWVLFLLGLTQLRQVQLEEHGRPVRRHGQWIEVVYLITQLCAVEGCLPPLPQVHLKILLPTMDCGVSTGGCWIIDGF